MKYFPINLPIPYRVKYRWQLRKWQRETHAICETDPIRPLGGQCTICTQLRHDDVQMYLIAIKSLLRWQVKARVAVFDDGDLSGKDIQQLEHHVPGIQIFTRQMTDSNPVWTEVSEKIRDIRGYYSSYRFTTNVIAFVQTRKRLHMDADLVWQHKPTELLHWIEKGDRGIAMHVPQRPLPDNASGKGHIQQRFRRAVPSINKILGQDGDVEDGLVGCLLGYDKEQITFILLEAVVCAAERLELPIHHWGGQQVIMNYMLSLSGYNLLPTSTYINFWPPFQRFVPTAKGIHFIGSRRFVSGTYAKTAASVIQELKRLSDGQ